MRPLLLLLLLSCATPDKMVITQTIDIGTGTKPYVIRTSIWRNELIEIYTPVEEVYRSEKEFEKGLFKLQKEEIEKAKRWVEPLPFIDLHNYEVME